MPQVNLSEAAAKLIDSIKQARQTFIEETGIIPRICLVETEQHTNCGTRGTFGVEILLPINNEDNLTINRQ